MKKNIEPVTAGENQHHNRGNFSTDTANELIPGKILQVLSGVESYGMLLLDKSGVILSWNKGAELLLGYNAAEVIGKELKILYPQENPKDGIQQALLNKVTNSENAGYEGWIIRKDGSRFWGTLSLDIICNSATDTNYYLCLIQNLTSKKSTDDRLHNDLEELRLKNDEIKTGADRSHKMMSEIQDYAIIFLDTDGKILDWNKGAEKLKGYSASEILGKSFRLFYTEEDREANLPNQLLDEAREKGFTSHEGYRIRKDGTRFWGNVTITAIHDDNNLVIGFSKVTKDLTERKNADDRVSIFTQELHQKNEELRQSEERYHRMIAEVQDYAILLMDKDGNIQNWNTGAEFIKGYSAAEIIGKNFRLFYTSDDVRSRLPERLLLEAEIRGKASNEGWRKRKDDTLFWANVVITALHDESGNLIGYSKVTRDLTDKKRIDDELKQKTIDLELKNLELEKLNSELSSFAYVVSHDLKEPIRKIQVFAGRQLEQDKTTDQVFDYSGKIIATASRMQNLMLALLNYSQLTKGDLPTEKINLNEIVDAVMHDLEIIITERKAEITKDILPLIPGIGYQLHQLFLNLMSNALKFSKPGMPPEIEISCKPASQLDLPDVLLIKNRKYWLISFSDKGLGFEQEHAARIFDVFQRLRPKEDISGTGIGLSIVKKVIMNHDGLIEVESQLNQGTCFKIYLPQ